MQHVFSEDPHRMNWLRPDFPYAQVRLPDPARHVWGRPPGLHASVASTRRGDDLHTEITIRNDGDRPYFARAGDIGLTLPLEDRYDLGVDQMTRRCNAHLYCGGTSSYVVALRAGGEAPHLGLVLTSGSLASYSIERDLSSGSNDRGCFVLHPSPFELAPGESTTISWTIFPFADLEDFHSQAGARTRFVRVEWERYVLFPGETSILTITPSFDAEVVRVNGTEVPRDGRGRYRCSMTASERGEQSYRVEVDEQCVETRILVKPPLSELIESRCRFIAEHQQYRGPDGGLAGALLTYDNEDERVFYSTVNDFNAGRERVGMGMLLANYLIALRDGVLIAWHPGTDALVRACLDGYRSYVVRELVDVATGAVYNDFQRDDSHERLYNAPWFAGFFISLHALDGDVDDLRTACRILHRFYDDGGQGFYPLEIPIVALCEALATAGLDDELEALRPRFVRHAEQIEQTGTSYPAHEVNYEQSIVAPAVDILLQVAIAAREPRFVEAARPHLRALEQFQGMQPDYHLNEVAIRHWDGFWFGKREQYGDTFPHYWSALTGNVLLRLHAITGEPAHAARASASLRGVLTLIFDDGRASCAYVFPHCVNRRRTSGFDPYANDQDWGLYFALRKLVDAPGQPL